MARPIGRLARIGQHQRRPNVDARIDELEISRQHADDGPGGAVDRDSAIDDAGIAAEAALPEAVRDDRHAVLPADFLVGVERPPERGTHAQQYPDANRGHSASTVRMQDDFVQPIRTSLVLVFAAVGFVLLIACLNVASLLLARAASRTREMAVRAALGASRGRLVAQTFVEGLALSLAGGRAGLVVARLTLAAFPAVMPAHLSIVGLSTIALDTRVLAFAFALSLVTGALFSLLPALHASRPQVVEALKAGGAGGRQAAGVRRSARLALVIGEVALAALTLTGAGLAVRSFVAVLSQPLGFESAHRVALTVYLPSARYPTVDARRAAMDDLERRLGAMPGVTSIGAADILPLTGDDARRGVDIEGRQPDSTDSPTRMHPRTVTPGYLKTMGIPIREGRGFSREDDERALPVAIVTEAAARRYWPNASPIGARFRFRKSDPWRTIVGVAGDVRHWGLSKPVNPMVYLPQAQFVSDGLSFVLDTRVDAQAIVMAARTEIAAFDHNLPLGDSDTLDAIVSRSLRPQRAPMVLMAAFGVLALLLAAVGIYGVMAQLAAMRVHEIGVRLSLGARPIDILRQSLVAGLLQTTAGLAIGLAAGAFLMRFAQAALFGVKPWDAVTLASVSGVLVGAALLATFIPARRAMKVDPVAALRGQ